MQSASAAGSGSTAQNSPQALTLEHDRIDSSAVLPQVLMSKTDRCAGRHLTLRVGEQGICTTLKQQIISNLRVPPDESHSELSGEPGRKLTKRKVGQWSNAMEVMAKGCRWTCISTHNLLSVRHEAEQRFCWKFLLHQMRNESQKLQANVWKCSCMCNLHIFYSSKKFSACTLILLSP